MFLVAKLVAVSFQSGVEFIRSCLPFHDVYDVFFRRKLRLVLHRCMKQAQTVLSVSPTSLSGLVPVVVDILVGLVTV